MFWVQRYDIFRILQGFCGKNIVYLIGERSSCSVIQVTCQGTGPWQTCRKQNHRGSSSRCLGGSYKGEIKLRASDGYTRPHNFAVEHRVLVVLHEHRLDEHTDLADVAPKVGRLFPMERRTLPRIIEAGFLLFWLGAYAAGCAEGCEDGRSHRCNDLNDEL